ncbi:TetR/AcrR family transcriptional regulator [Streptomyces sp. R302]|uniref:TetR/AcrR family transcriptional regulator n=1 Tax=unclassified Streptomyces TaxID=2593676 RepID=UPI00145EE2B6|nr:MULTISPECIES: TetR/AcrR family transcriptional regulator [unclassified Streptomyces]NML48957.1 TetR/AcrR family transcriptional regulator [Streptomyces sp. R301]NML77284.1 TetR/AcrR family transcriptional regulator [Streptomyces sp. R302]
MPEDPKPRRRQARGERRISQLLQAAADVFCASGYTAASTNAIAREAKVSPGTLYQYFPNKEAIAVELGGRLIQQMRAAHGQVFTPANMALPLPELVDAVLDPMIEFNCLNPAFLALMHGSDIPGRIAEEHDELHASLLSQVRETIGARAVPPLAAADLDRVADMAFAVFKGGLALIVAAPEGPVRDAAIGELKKVLVRYLAPVFDETPTDAAVTTAPTTTPPLTTPPTPR